MPKFLVDKLKREYPGNPSAVYGTLNALGAMRGNKETSKGRAMQAQHNRDVKAGRAQGMAQGGKVRKQIQTAAKNFNATVGQVRKMHPNSMKNLTAPKFKKAIR